MFCCCDRFDQSIDGWNVSSVKDFGRMLLGAASFSKSVAGILKTAGDNHASSDSMLEGAVCCPEHVSKSR